MKTIRLPLIIIITIIPVVIIAQCNVFLKTNIDPPLCEGTNITFIATAYATPPVSYIWTRNGITVNNGTNNTYTTSLAGDYYVIIYDKYFCSALSSTMTIMTRPVQPDFIVPPTACGNTDFVFSNATPGGMSSYIWNFGDGNTAKGISQSHRYENAIGNGIQNYHVQLTIVNSNGCSNSINKTVAVKQIPDATLQDVSPDINEPFVHCNVNANDCNLTVENSSSTINSNSNYEIKWGDDSTNIFDNTFDRITHNYNSKGEYKLNYTIKNNSGCITTKSYKYYCGRNPEGALLASGNTNGCAKQKFMFQIINTENNQDGTKYTFSFCDGSPDTLINHPPPAYIEHRYNAASCGIESCFGANSYGVKLTIQNPCGSTVNTVYPIYISDKPANDFEITSLLPEIYAGDTIKLINKTTSCCINSDGSADSGMTLNWEISPATDYSITEGILTEDKPGIKLNKAGNYTIKLKTENSCCGISESVKQITVYPASNITNINKKEQKVFYNSAENIIIINEARNINNIAVYDVLGAVVFNKAENIKGNFRIKLPQLRDGIYLINYTTEDSTNRVKFVKL